MATVQQGAIGRIAVLIKLVEDGLFGIALVKPDDAFVFGVVLVIFDLAIVGRLPAIVVISPCS
jgi:hypothetical protein